LLELDVRDGLGPEDAVGAAEDGTVAAEGAPGEAEAGGEVIVDGATEVIVSPAGDRIAEVDGERGVLGVSDGAVGVIEDGPAVVGFRPSAIAFPSQAEIDSEARVEVPVVL